VAELSARRVRAGRAPPTVAKTRSIANMRPELAIKCYHIPMGGKGSDRRTVATRSALTCAPQHPRVGGGDSELVVGVKTRFTLRVVTCRN
jgi:hypothetical protein